MQINDCPLCLDAAAPALWRDEHCRVVSAADADYPAFLRVIWQAHVREMTDLDPASQQHLLRVVLTVERVLRAELSPHKINLATLGNQVPHLHWHVIPRFTDDAHFPDPVWAARRRAGVAHAIDDARLKIALSATLPR
jgi:diadenosine tetraphosphate (Ap4A) HIT family hydrolase